MTDATNSPDPAPVEDDDTAWPDPVGPEGDDEALEKDEADRKIDRLIGEEASAVRTPD
jgi:hypothetical protein